MIPAYLQGPSPSSVPPSPSSILPPPGPRQSTSKLTSTTTTSTDSPLSITKSFRAYYSPIELNQLVKLQASSSARNSDESASSNNNKKDISEVRVEAMRQLACGFIERVGGRLGL